MASIHKKKLFPLRLPENYHGQLKAKPSLMEQSRSKMLQREKQQFYETKKIGNWEKKRFDHDVIRQRKLFVSPGKISEENPEWMKTTYDCFRRGSVQPIKKQTRSEWESYDVFGRPRKISFADNSSMIQSRFRSQSYVSAKVGEQSRWRQTVSKQVTPKVGYIETRDLSIRRPQLKVGKTDFIDTYTPF